MVEQIKVVADAAYPLDGILTLPDSPEFPVRITMDLVLAQTR